MNYIIQKLGLATTTSIIVSEVANLDMLWNALITLGISVVSVLTVEGVALLTKYIKKLSDKVDQDKKDKTEKADK